MKRLEEVEARLLKEKTSTSSCAVFKKTGFFVNQFLYIKKNTMIKRLLSVCQLLHICFVHRRTNFKCFAGSHPV